MKRLSLSISLLLLFMLSSCNNQPAKRQNGGNLTDPNADAEVLADYQEEETAQTKDYNTPGEQTAEEGTSQLPPQSTPSNADFAKSATIEESNRPKMSADELEQRRAAALEKRRKREEAQRARAIARAEQSGDQQTIQQERTRTNTAELQEKYQSTNKEDILPAKTREQLENVKKDYKDRVPEDKATNLQSPLNSSDQQADRPVVDHSDWDYLLRQYVSKTGDVDYAGLKSDQKQLKDYLKQLKNYPPAKSWTREDKMAYWINAYNAFTIQLILDNYPLSSITNLDGGKPWDQSWIKLGTKTYSLNDIENKILRPVYKDPRIHFAVNCAAASCPPLLNRAWTATNLERQLENQTRAFINNPKYNTIKEDKIEVSKIFDWYAEDFGDLIDFLNQYSNTEIDQDAAVSYKEYDWSLNE